MDPKILLCMILCLTIIFTIYFIQNRVGEVKVTQHHLRYIQKQIEENQIFVATKSFCPYSKQVLRSLTVDYRVPENKLKILELDDIPIGPELTEALYQMNGQRTTPMVYINHIFIGGHEEYEKLRKDHKLSQMITDAIHS